MAKGRKRKASSADTDVALAQIARDDAHDERGGAPSKVSAGGVRRDWGWERV